MTTRAYICLRVRRANNARLARPVAAAILATGAVVAPVDVLVNLTAYVKWVNGQRRPHTAALLEDRRGGAREDVRTALRAAAPMPGKRRATHRARGYEKKPLVLTTNLAFADWHTVFPSATCATALVERVVHHADIVKIEGESYRLRESQLDADKRGASRRDKTPPLLT